MKKILLFLLLCLPIVAAAQTDPKYLAGAVTLEDGKVTFKTEIQTPSLTREELYETMLAWANNRFKPDDKFNARVLYTNADEGIIAAGGEEYIVFTSTALSLDRSRIYYQLFITCEPGKCGLEMTRIHYWYDEARNGGEKYTAEEWIIDKMALNKSKTKLAPICGKFRRETIDLKDELFQSVQATLGNHVLSSTQNAQTVAPVQVTAPENTPVVSSTVVTPTVEQPTEKAPVNLDEQIEAAVRMTITAGNDEQFEIGKECWGGFGQLFGKEVSFCLIDTQKTMGNLLLSQSEEYKVSFYQKGSNEPQVVINCKKLTQQSITGEEARKMNPNNDAEKTYNLYVGEVVK